MIKKKFVYLCQEYPINLTFEEAEKIANEAVQRKIDLSQLYSDLYSIYKSIKIIEAQANWFDNFRKRL